MKISDLFGSNKNIATINFACMQQGITMPECEVKRIEQMLQVNQRFFVFVDKGGLDIVLMREKSDLLSKIVSGRMKRGKVLFFHDGAYRAVTRENWEETRRMISPSKLVLRDDRIPVSNRKQTAFDEGMPERPHKKFSRKGFLCTLIANESMQRVSKPII